MKPVQPCEGCGEPFAPKTKAVRFHSVQCYYRNGKRPIVDRPDLDPTQAPTPLDVAWAAGVYEGEGTCEIGSAIGASGRPDGSFRVSVTQKDRWLLDRLRDLFGGSVALHERTKADRCPMYHWRVSGDRADAFIAAIYEYLSPRRKAQLARRFDA